MLIQYRVDSLTILNQLEAPRAKGDEMGLYLLPTRIRLINFINIFPLAAFCS